MRMVLSRTYLRAIILAWPLVSAASACGGEIQISVTNNQPTGGFALSTVWVGLHDGTFSTFSSGAMASPALQAVAELGDSTMLQAAFTGHGVQTTFGLTHGHATCCDGIGWGPGTPTRAARVSFRATRDRVQSAEVDVPRWGFSCHDVWHLAVTT